ncbi:MAG: hypothetical protein U0169_19125 [Polyangiaceae bacterium]
MPRRLVDVLRALPTRELDALVSRLGIRIDSAKRIDAPSQIGRALVALPEVRDPHRLPTASLELLHRVAEARGSLAVDVVPPALEPLAARGIMFARATGVGVELVVPPAYLVQFRSWEGEDPKGIRALLAQAPLETLSAIAAHYLGRPATPPVSLALETAFETLVDPGKLAAEIERLAPTERRVLEGVSREGGEVDTEELLELEREPVRMRTAMGSVPSRRGVGFALERRGLLVPMHPNRHVIPTEVGAIIGAAESAEKAARRERVRTFVQTEDLAPRRARFATDPAPLAMGLALAARESGNEVRPNIGTPKSLVARLATRFGQDPHHVALVIALSRAVGLWDPSAVSSAAPPGALCIHELLPALYETWRRGGAWDEGRNECEVLRLPADARDPSPASVVRELVVAALHELGEERWVPWSQLRGYLKSDPRMPGASRLFRRWAERTGADEVDAMEVARRIVLESMPALGFLDVGEDAATAEVSDSTDGPPSTRSTSSIRLTPRGRALLAGKSSLNDETPSKFLDSHVLRLGQRTKVSSVFALSPFVEVGRAGDVLDLIVAPQTLARALSAGVEAEVLRHRIEAVAPLPETLSRTLQQASVVVGRGTFVASAGFLWVDDANLRELLRTRRTTGELFADPSPPGGLLLLPGVDLDKLVRRARTVGVEIVSDGTVVRARTVPPPRVTPSRGTKA